MSINCSDCCYFYRDSDGRGNEYGVPRCHYSYDDGYAPCEVDDYDSESPDLDEYYGDDDDFVWEEIIE